MDIVAAKDIFPPFDDVSKMNEIVLAKSDVGDEALGEADQLFGGG